MQRTLLMLTALLLSGCALMQQLVETPTLRVANVSMASGGLMEQVVTFEFLVDNPNPFRLPVAGMAYTLELGGVEVGRGEQSQGITLPANGTARWPVTFRINGFKLAQGLLERGNLKDLDYRLFGSFRFSDSTSVPGLPFDKRGLIGG